MTKTTMRSLRLLTLACAALVLFAQPGLGQKSPARHGEPTPPIQLGDITVEYQIQNDAGQLVWQASGELPGNPNVIQVSAGAQRLRLTASVGNRDNGRRIRFRAALQEVCQPKEGGKPYITSLKHLTESDPNGGQTGESTDDELRVVERGKVSIELPVHCEDCVRESCGSRGCDGKDHLGEGPHVIVVTTSDPPPTDPETGPAARATAAKPSASAAAAKPSSYRLDVKTFCPKPGEGKAGSKKPGR